MKERFALIFFPQAEKEFQALDGSVKAIVAKKMAILKYRADEIGEECHNTDTAQLAGCRRIKFRDTGIRVVYRITDQHVDVLQIVQIITVGKRENEEVYQLAASRLADLGMRLHEGPSQETP